MHRIRGSAEWAAQRLGERAKCCDVEAQRWSGGRLGAAVKAQWWFSQHARYTVARRTTPQQPGSRRILTNTDDSPAVPQHRPRGITLNRLTRHGKSAGIRGGVRRLRKSRSHGV